MAEEKSRAEVRMLQAAQHVTIATVTTEQVQQYARSTTTKISEKFLDEKEKLPNDGSEDDGVHADSGEFPNSSLLGRNDMKDVPLKNTPKRLFSEIGDDLPSSHIMSILTPCSRIEKEFEPEFWAELIADRPPAVNATYYEEIGSICDHLFGPLGEKLRSKLHESRDKWVKIRDLKAPEYNEGFSYNEEDWKKILSTSLDAFESEYNPIQQNDCGEKEWFGEYVIPIFQGALKLNSFCRVPWGEITVVASCRRRNENKKILEECLEQEVVCGLACGGPHKYDLTKWASDEYQLPRMLKDTLDDILEKFRGASRDSSNLYTIGIQVR
ncbi:hypothetical protein RhiirC2_763634 [Rhizophagus irregularis]|uniref:Uncharacterized protein n=1 Tax=Rhizophagus irregularis TaxID=588596 RepID=A0A2N1M8S1_9GLOM|nr:hypothetical protein RhiirC2_763634 [Rhizophagus irregularis]